MKRIIGISSGALLIFLAVVCTFGAVISAFSFSVNWTLMLAVWSIYAVLVSVIATRFEITGILISLIPIIILLFLQRHAYVYGLQWVFYVISNLYSEWMPTPVFFSETALLIERYDYYVEPTFFFLIVGLIISSALAVTICLRRSVLMTALMTAPILFLSFVLIHIQPDTRFFLGLLAVYISMFFSSLIHPDDFQKRGLLLVPALVVAIIFMGLSYLVAAPDRHDREGFTDTLSTGVRTITAQVGMIWQGTSMGMDFEFGWPMFDRSGIWQFDTATVDIAGAGARSLLGVNLIEVTASEPGTFYLRGYSMAYFDGRAWHRDVPEHPGSPTAPHIPQDLEEIALAMPAHIASIYYNAGLHDEFSDNLDTPISPPTPVTMTITQTGDATDVTFRPYHSLHTDNFHYNYFFHVRDNIHELNERVRHAFIDLVTIERTPETERIFIDTDVAFFDVNNQLVFRVPNDFIIRGTVDDDGFNIFIPDLYQADRFAEYSALLEAYGLYTVIDPDLARSLRVIALHAGINVSGYDDHATIAEDVARFVRRSASYSLQISPTPPNEDFTLHFLQTAEYGYCIHFATAATMMLRALGIPARFTTGYAVTISPAQVNQTVVLTDANAHAWVEVFHDGIGWLYLEVTPSTAYNIIPFLDSDFLDGPPDGTDLDAMLHDDLSFVPPNGYMNGTQGGHGNDGVTQEDATPPSQISMFFSTLLLIFTIPAIALSLIIRRLITQKIRKKRFSNPDTNFAVIRAWRYVIRFKTNNIVISPDIEELALKASFSQHRLSEEERNIVVNYVTKTSKEIYNGSGDFGRFWLKYIRAVV